MSNELRHTLRALQEGSLSIDEALSSIEGLQGELSQDGEPKGRQHKSAPFVDLDFAKVDLDRKARTGVSEVIFGQGKTAGQIASIADALIENGQDHIIATRVDAQKAARVASITPNATYHEQAHIISFGNAPAPDGIGRILIATAGTSDIPVAEEAAVTAEMLGNEVVRAYDMGVAGLHRTLAHLDDIQNASVIIAIAGMEGALASLIAGLAACPVIAVPTSVGYGASFGGVSALLSMLNSCASGVSVVNIDNGFGAAYQAHLINHMK